jgi:F0F1-type ATP synthase membrane subunit c/vacuolar-type H+-ATPase subunit K
MDGYVIGLVVGIGAGIAIGISIGKKQKSWSELNESERKLRIGIIAGLSVLVVAGLVVFLLRLYS